MADVITSEDRAVFSAPYDGVTKALSIVVCIFQLFLIVAIHNIVVDTIMILIVLITYAYSPRGYTVANRAITVKRLIGNVRVPLDNLREARRIRADDLRGAMRLWASGGLFGYFGLYRTSHLGKCTWYATDRKKTVVLIGAKKTTVFSPDDVDGFLQAIRAQVPVPVEGAGPTVLEFGDSPALSPTSAAGSIVLLGIIMAIVAGLGILAALLVAMNHARHGLR